MENETNRIREFCSADNWTFVGSLLICFGGCAVSVGNLLRMKKNGRLSEHNIQQPIFSESKPVTSSSNASNRARDYFL